MVGPWWEVDLGRPYSLERARIFNRQEPLFYQRAAKLRVLLSDDSSNWRVVYDNAGKVFGPEPLVVNAEPNSLHLEEVEVYGR